MCFPFILVTLGGHLFVGLSSSSLQALDHVVLALGASVVRNDLLQHKVGLVADVEFAEVIRKSFRVTNTIDDQSLQNTCFFQKLNCGLV